MQSRINILSLIFGLILSVNAVSFKIVKVEKCTSSNKSMDVITCEGYGNTVSLILNLHRALSKLNVQLNLFKSDSSDYKSIFKSRPIEWCAVVAGKVNTNPIVKTFIKSSIAKLPEVVRKCPMHGRLEVKNFVFNSKAMAILPPSNYKLTARAFDKVDKEILDFELMFKIIED